MTWPAGLAEKYCPPHARISYVSIESATVQRRGSGVGGATRRASRIQFVADASCSPSVVSLPAVACPREGARRRQRSDSTQRVPGGKIVFQKSAGPRQGGRSAVQKRKRAGAEAPTLVDES